MCADHIQPLSKKRDASRAENPSKIELSGIRTNEGEEGHIIPSTSSSSNFKKTFSATQKDKSMKVRLVELTEKSFFPRDLNEYNHSTDICIMEQELSPELTATIQESNKVVMKTSKKRNKHKPKKQIVDSGSNQSPNDRPGNVNKIGVNMKNSDLQKLSKVNTNYVSSVNNNSKIPAESNYYNLISPVQSNFFVINPPLQPKPTHLSNVQYCLGDPLYSQMKMGHFYQQQNNSNLYLTNNPINHTISSSLSSNPYGSHHLTQLNQGGFIGQQMIPQNNMNLQSYTYTYRNPHLLNPSISSLPNYLRPSNSTNSRFLDLKPKCSDK